MKTIVLPGFSLRNKFWAEQVVSGLKPELDAITIGWEHWQSGEKQFDWEGEITKVTHLLTEKSHIVAKSVGSIVAAAIHHRFPDRLDKMILCGIPLSTSDQEGKMYLGELGKHDPRKVLIFQNEQDPYGSATTVKDFFASMGPAIKVISKSRQDHDYPFVDEFKQFLML